MKHTLLVGSIALFLSSPLAFAVYQHHHHHAANSQQSWSDNAKEGWHGKAQGDDWSRHHLSQTTTSSTDTTVTKTKPTRSRPTKAK